VHEKQTQIWNKEIKFSCAAEFWRIEESFQNPGTLQVGKKNFQEHCQENFG
jgi:hypothetical protein